MSRLAIILFGPVWVSRRKRKQLVDARSRLDPVTQPEDYARLTEQIKLEENFVASFTSFVNERRAIRFKQSMSVSFKGIFKLLGLFALVFVVIGLKRYFLDSAP
jgi:hypothetical protein